MVVPPILVRRLKSHFITLPCGVDLILGLNGYIWVSKHVKQSDREGEEGFDAEAVYSNQNDVGLLSQPNDPPDLNRPRLLMTLRELPFRVLPTSFAY